MKTYKDIVKSQSDLKNYHIENNMLEAIEINVIGHVGNLTTLEMFFTNCCLFSQYNLGNLIGTVLKVIFEVLELTEDNGLRLSKVKNVPVRIVSENSWGSKVIGFGHFMKDRFVLVEDVIAIARENLLLSMGNEK